MGVSHARDHYPLPKTLKVTVRQRQDGARALSPSLAESCVCLTFLDKTLDR